MTRATVAIAAALFASVAIAGPAAAAPTAPPSDDEVCWLNADNGDYRCFDSEAEFERAVAAEGIQLVDPEAPAVEQRSTLAAAAAGTIIARFYADTGYSGSVMAVTSANSSNCNGYSYSGNMPWNWNDRVSSFRAYHGCAVKFWDNAGYSGASFGYYSYLSSMGSFNDRASSYRVS